MVDANSNGSTTGNVGIDPNYVPQPQHVCPNCGFCPCCGRRNVQPYPVFQPWPGYPNPYIGDGPLPEWYSDTIKFGPETIQTYY